MSCLRIASQTFLFVHVELMKAKKSPPQEKKYIHFFKNLKKSLVELFKNKVKSITLLKKKNIFFCHKFRDDLFRVSPYLPTVTAGNGSGKPLSPSTQKQVGMESKLEW